MRQHPPAQAAWCVAVLLPLLAVLAAPVATAPAPAGAGAGTKSATPATNICGENATLGRAVVAALNLSYPGLDAVAAAAVAGDLDAACDALATYYATANTSAWLRGPPVAPGTQRVGGDTDRMVDSDYFYLNGVALGAVIPRNADGGLNWLDHGPRDDQEFMNCLNRHDSFVNLMKAWRATGNPVYTRYFDALARDWVLHLPCPNALAAGPGVSPCVPLGAPSSPGGAPNCSWEGGVGVSGADDSGVSDKDAADDTPQQPRRQQQQCATGTMESPWRSLEMGLRMGVQWPASFFGFQNAPTDDFSVSARVLLVLGISEHQAALLADGGHPGSGTPNWEIFQWQGLCTSAVAFPELRNASGFLAAGLDYLTGLLAKSVYPDGVETEMASSYDMGTARDFLGTLQVIHEATGGRHAPLPPAFVDRVEAMFDYGAYVATPLGCLPRNGDSDLCENGFFADAAEYFNRSDWVYVHSNGAQGAPAPATPTRGPTGSVMFPWAGQVVFRSGFDRNATWGWFDVGPYGSSGHAHRDKLSLNLHARGSMLLVDSGRFAYAGTDLSATLHVQYARNASAHNTLTLDGCDQLPEPALAVAPVPTDSWALGGGGGGGGGGAGVDAAAAAGRGLADWAFSNFSLYAHLQGAATHMRGVHYQHAPPVGTAAASSGGSGDGDFFVVVDVVATDRPRSVQATWHAHPNASVAVNATSLAAAVGGVAPHSGQPTAAQACVVPARPAPGSLSSSSAAAAPLPVPVSSIWTSAAVVRGRRRDESANATWQGWFSQEYDDAHPASVVVYDGAVAAAGVACFAWLIVPTAGPANCAASTAAVVVVTPTTATVAVRVDGGPAQNVTVSFAR